MYIKLKGIRNKYNLSIEDLSKRSGVSYSEILNIEDRLINPLVPTILKLSKALNIELDESLFKGNYINKLRKKSNLSLRKLEKLSGVSKSQINDIEREVKNPTLITICKLLKALDIEIDNELFSNKFL